MWPLIKELTVFGLASNKVIKIISIPEYLPEDLTLMNFLISNGITIASSCDGVGSCHKCLINQIVLSCQITLSEFIKTNQSLLVKISYL